MPILPVVVIALVGAIFSLIDLVRGWPARSWHRAARWAVLALVIPIAGVGALAAARGVALVGKGHTPESDFSPQTVRHIKDHVPPGTMLAANQMQLWAFTLDYGFLMIPWDQPLDNWPRDYGISPWTRLEALKVFVEKDVRYVVLFFGPTHGERVLARYNPGPYVGSSLLTEPLPEVAGVTRLSDGVLVTLADREQLRELLAKEPPSGAGPRQ
jgi:voltage-gated potassium channel Kch